MGAGGRRTVKNQPGIDNKAGFSATLRLTGGCRQTRVTRVVT